jgi:hypothetical protein
MYSKFIDFHMKAGINAKWLIINLKPPEGRLDPLEMKNLAKLWSQYGLSIISGQALS